MLVKEEVADVAREPKLPSLRKSSSLQNSRKICSLKIMIPIIKEWSRNINRCRTNKCLNQLRCHSRSLFRCKCLRRQSWVNNSRTACSHSLRRSCPLRCHSQRLLLQWTPSRSLSRMHLIGNSSRRHKINKRVMSKITMTMKMNTVMMTITTNSLVQMPTNLTL